MNRMELFKNAKEHLADLFLRCPEATVIVSMQNQIDYLIELESGENHDRSRLKDIILGVQTAREIEPRDAAVAAIVYQVAEAAKEMERQ